MKNYDFMINLAHFKGHMMGGFGGVLKNQSIGVASSAGKAYIHSAGFTEDVMETWNHIDNQDGFLESMAAAAQAVHNYFGRGERILYINVVNNLSVDCDCDSHPADPEMSDIGILASLDPVALDQACVDLVFHYPSEEGDNAAALIERINSRHGIHTIEHAAKIGLGSRDYNLVSIDGEQMLEQLNEQSLSLLVRNHGVTTMHENRGVQDLLSLIKNEPARLKGAVVADKMVGKAAAALMIAGGVKTVYTNLICTPARELFEKAGVSVVATEEVPQILNRDKSGQCPIDSRLNGVETVEECVRILQSL
jgi:predicted Fe-Mo cluster-binding NifX family protein